MALRLSHPACVDADATDLGHAPPSPFRWRQYLTSLKSRDGWIGSYNYGALLIPDLPFVKKRQRLMPFFGVNDTMPALLALLLGLQHALAMVGGIITPPLLLGGSSGVALDPSVQQYLLSASLIWCAVATALQVSRVGPVHGYFYGTVGH
jgi:hypothetical protein